MVDDIRPDGGASPRIVGARILNLSVVRIVLAVFVTALAGGLTQAGLSSISDRRFHIVWPDLCGALAAIAAYALYVRWVESDRSTELSSRRALPNWVSGSWSARGWCSPWSALWRLSVPINCSA
jgi:hypothetical protein